VSENAKGSSRLITSKISDKTLREDLENFRQKAFNLGASVAEIIPADWVEIDERVSLKCSIPLCPYYDKCLFCPPHTPSPEFMRKALGRYRHAIISALDVIPVEEFAGRPKERGSAENWAKKSFEIAGRIETLAFGSGYHLAMGFAQASCLKALCGQERCLVLEGKKCPYPLKSRPSMEAVGIDVYRLVTRVGWDIYPIYRSVNCEQVSRALSVSIVFIA
jgi:predicted metal-binding protein